MLVILGGLPGVGKSTIGKKIAKKIKAVYLRIDSIEQAIKDASKFNRTANIDIVAEGYMAGYAVAKDNLAIGLTVIADSVNSIEITRQDYRNVAQEANTPYIEIEIICSDPLQHKNRVETRKPSITNLKQLTWQDVLDREYEEWQTKNMTIDTAIHSEEEAAEMIIHEINKRCCTY